MPKISWNPDAKQAYNFEPENQAPVGFVQSFKIGTRNLFKDVKLKPPTRRSTGAEVSYVGVIEKVEWGGAASDKLTLDFRVSTANRHLLVNLTHAATADTVVELSFTLFDYDTEALEFYEAFKTDAGGIKGTLAYVQGIDGSGLDLKVSRAGDSGAGTKVAGVEDFYVATTITPFVGVSQNLHFATGKNMSLVKKWGTPAESGTGVGGSDATTSERTAPTETTSSSGDREAVERLERKVTELETQLADAREHLVLTVQWLRALSEKVDLKSKEADAKFTAKSPAGKLGNAEAARLKQLQATINDGRDALASFAP